MTKIACFFDQKICFRDLKKMVIGRGDGKSLVAQPMMHSQPNQTEKRTVDSYSQILCKFQKSKQKAPPQY